MYILANRLYCDRFGLCEWSRKGRFRHCSKGFGILVDIASFFMYNKPVAKMREGRLLMQILIRALGIIGLVLSFIPFQFKRHKHIVLCKMLSSCVFSVQYFLMGAYTGAWLDLVSALRNYLFYKFVDRKLSTLPVTMAFSLLIVVLGIGSWGGWLSLLPIIAKLLSTVSYGMKNERMLRFIALPSCILWIVYNLMVGGYEAAIGDFLAFVSIIIAIYQFDIRKAKR